MPCYSRKCFPVNIFLLLLISLISWFTTAANGQSSALFFEKPTALQHPNLSSVNCIYKDSHHIMWFGTESGLYRYDGTNIRYFCHHSQDTNTLPDNNVQQI